MKEIVATAGAKNREVINGKIKKLLAKYEPKDQLYILTLLATNIWADATDQTSEQRFFKVYELLELLGVEDEAELEGKETQNGTVPSKVPNND